MFEVKNLSVPLCLFCLALAGGASTVRAQGNDSSTLQPSRNVKSADLDMDREVDNGADDDKSNSDSEPSKFKKDSDDTYRDISAKKDDSYRSKFKEDRDAEDADHSK